ncbi:MAG TPA: sulfotransferase, partial [Candidatus Eremiobacteraceae bacterium]|nr:sulfotransferase [Candidatus Eremiobacteraceae bacterium]
MLFGGAVRNVLVRYFIDHGEDPTRTVLVVGMGRSGTTWLAELLNYRNTHRLVFEPFYHRKVALAVNFTDHQYLRPDNDDPRFVRPALAILSGQVRCNWTDQYNRRLIGNRRIVKDVRVNLILRWLHDRFPGMPTVAIVRHPFAVAASRLSHGHDVDIHREFLAQPLLVEDYLFAYRDELLACRTPFERIVATWCIEVGLPLSQFSQDELCLVYYEHLCTMPAETMERAFRHIGVPFTNGALRALTKPSPMTYVPTQLEESWRKGPDHLVNAWRGEITDAQIVRGLEILRAFGMDGVYGAGPMPLEAGYPKTVRFGAR